MTVGAGWFDRWLDASGFVARLPHYAGTLARMEPRASRAVETMAVARQRRHDTRARVDLFVNVAYFEAHPEHFAGILLHEVQHVVLGHLDDGKFHAVERPEVMEVAMEISANEPITDPLPGGVHLRDFARFGLRAGQSTLERYALLVEAVDAGELDLAPWSGRMIDAHRVGGAALGDALDRGRDRHSPRNWNRRLGLGDPAFAEEIEAMKRAIREHLRGEAGGDDDPSDPTRPRVSKDLPRAIVAVDARGALDWARVLAQAFPRRRVVEPDHRRVNRRHPHRLGEVPGRARRPPRPRLVAVVDTSGSMGVEALACVARELRRLARHARVTVVESDAAVLRVSAPGAVRDGFLGGGDTDFDPALERARTDGDRPEGVVYFTDGRGEVPARTALPVLWVLTSDDPFDGPGAMVRLPVDEAG